MKQPKNKLTTPVFREMLESIREGDDELRSVYGLVGLHYAEMGLKAHVDYSKEAVAYLNACMAHDQSEKKASGLFDQLVVSAERWALAYSAPQLKNIIKDVQDS